MPNGDPSSGYSRIEPDELVAGAHVIPEISEGAARLVISVIASIIMATLGILVAWLVSWLLLILFVPLGIGTAWSLSRPTRGPGLAEFIQQRLIAPGKRLPIANSTVYDNLTTAGGIVAGDWVCLKASHDEARRKYRDTYGKSAPSPDVNYSFVIATFALSGARQVVAFSDGSSVTWHPTSKVIVTRSPEIQYSWQAIDDESVQKIAAALVELVNVLAHLSGFVTFERLNVHVQEKCRPELELALVVAEAWELITVRECVDNNDFASSSNGGSWFKITQSGIHWRLASCEPRDQPAQDRKSMRRDTPGKQQTVFNIQGDFSGIFNNAGDDISGDSSATTNRGSATNEAILSYLAKILDSCEIQWSQRELADIRVTLEKAVRQGNPDMSGLKKAVSKLCSMCGQVLIGMLGNAAYQVLLSHYI